MARKESESVADFEAAIERFLEGQERAVREFVHARYEASLFKGSAETRKAVEAAKENWAREEAHLKFEFDKALRQYLDESSQRTTLEQSRKPRDRTDSRPPREGDGAKSG